MLMKCIAKIYFFRSEQSKTADLAFLADQKGRRLGRIGTEDKEYSSKVNLKRKREDCEERRMREEEERKNSDFNLVSIELEEENLPEVEAPPTRKKPRKLREVELKVNVKKWIEDTSIICNRYRVGVRPQTALIASLFTHSNVDLDTIHLSKSYVSKIRQNTVELDSHVIKETNKILMKDNLLTLHFDTKLTSEITVDGVNCVKDRLAVSVTSPNFDNQDLLLGKF